MTRQDLRNIHNIKDLEIAHLEIRNSLIRRRNSMRRDVSDFLNFFRPGRLLNSGWRAVAPASPSPGRILLGVVRLLKARLRRRA